MFQEDHYDPFESTYKEIIWNERMGTVQPLERLEDFGAVGETLPSVKGSDVKQDRSEIQPKKKRESYNSL